MKKSLSFLIIALSSFAIFAQSHFSTQSHQAQVTNLVAARGQNNMDSYFSTGDDGFVIKWGDDNQGEHYQFTDVGIKLIAVSPDGNDIAIYESDGGSINKVSVWNWPSLNRKFQKKFSDSITSLEYSAKGTYLIVGTATVDGALFYRTSDWRVVDKIKTNTSIVNYIYTSTSEKTCLLYSPAGSLSYFNLSDGKLKAKFQVIQGLSQTVMFNNDKLLAGVKDNQIYIINAFKGNSISSVEANNPVILSSEKDLNLYYLEYDGRNSYELKMLESQEKEDSQGKKSVSISNPRLIKKIKGTKNSASITDGIKEYGNIYLGSKAGSIFKINIDPSTSVETMTELTENTYSKIYGMAPADSDFYFLTSNAIYKSSYDTGVVDKLSNTNGETEILKYKDNNVILWTKSSRTPVIKMDLNQKTSEVLFTPANNIKGLKINSYEGKDYLVEIESNTNVNIYDLEEKTFKNIYSGTGIQDAVLTNNGNIYIGKSAATNPQVPLLSVNIVTQETVPISIKGNVTFAFSTNGTVIYGINLISDDTGKNTYVFSYDTSKKTMTNILRFPEEDPEATTYLNGNNLFTNIGKNKYYCYNLVTKKRFSYNRSASIPVNICQNGNRVVILNSNGSISWCGTSDSRLLADWYMTKDEQWFEF